MFLEACRETYSIPKEVFPCLSWLKTNAWRKLSVSAGQGSVRPRTEPSAVAQEHKAIQRSSQTSDLSANETLLWHCLKTVIHCHHLTNLNKLEKPVTKNRLTLLTNCICNDGS